MLIEDVALADATLIRARRSFLSAERRTASRFGSSWDALVVYSSEHFRWGHGGPIPKTPYSSIRRAARPAGAMWRRGNSLMRVAQDCRTGYGAGLAFARIDRLNEEDFSQTVTTMLAPPAGMALARRIHTLNQGAGYEVIDALLPRDPPP